MIKSKSIKITGDSFDKEVYLQDLHSREIIKVKIIEHVKEIETELLKVLITSIWSCKNRTQRTENKIPICSRKVGIEKTQKKRAENNLKANNI